MIQKLPQAEQCSRMNTLLYCVIGLALVSVMASCSSDSDPVEPDPPPEPAGWIWQNPLPQGNTLRCVSFTDVNTGTAVGDFGTILRTTNGGATWVSQSSGTEHVLTGVSFTDANSGTVVGGSGTILHTSNGGANWASQLRFTQSIPTVV